MKPEFKSKLIEVLRPGKYTQTMGRLRRGDCFCVLGVICDLVDPKAWTPYNLQTMMHNQLMMAPSQEVLDAIGMSADECRRLTILNDNDGLTFLEIADHLEKSDEAGIPQATGWGATVGAV